MPSLDWNRKWDGMIASFSPSAEETHWGDRWGDPETFAPLLQVRKKFIEPYIHPAQTLVEIGGGGGRMTQYLLSARKIIVVDFNPATFGYLSRRFADCVDKFEFYQTSGYEMHGIADNGVDFVFTFDVFVHLEPEGIGDYLKEIERVLKPGSKAVVHYGDITKPIAYENPGFSRMTWDIMQDLLGKTTLRVLEHDSETMFHSNLVVVKKPA